MDGDARGGFEPNYQFAFAHNRIQSRRELLALVRPVLARWVMAFRAPSTRVAVATFALASVAIAAACSFEPDTKFGNPGNFMHDAFEA